MKQLLSLSAMIVALTANAQIGVFSQVLDKATPVDTARYAVTYTLDYTCHPKADVRFNDVRTLLIGRHNVKDYSDIIHHYDSLATEQSKRGANTFSNPPGSPWQYEIMLSDRGRQADMKYRLPIGIGVLHYSEPVPVMQWEFAADSTRTILGFECQMATVEFAGRKYSAWFTTELPLPYGPYKFGGLPGLILKIEDAEKQFLWEATAFEKSGMPIEIYQYNDEKTCSSSEAAKTIERCYKTPNAFLLGAIGGGKGRIYITGKDGKTRDASEIEDTPIPYKSLEIK